MKCGCNAEGALDALRRFFTERGRDQPWRHPDAGPWAVLVSEVMLQQTPVARVLPVYAEWLRSWPTPADLAAADTAEVLRAWGRLGYPRRALRLREAAAMIVAEFDGTAPGTVPELLRLPGVGEYTARAVAAFAFGLRVPVVDTNVRRVLSRAVRGVDEHLPASAADRAEMAALLPGEPRDAVMVSAAVMELGALVCTVRNPDCDACPFRQWCRWRAEGYPAGPARRRPAQRWAGTDRQVRGAIMAVLREADGPTAEVDLRARVDGTLPAGPTGGHGAESGAGASYLDLRWQRCLASLIADGLATRRDDGRIGLP